MRGTGNHHASRCAKYRFIPACAGNSRSIRNSDLTLRGSSPRVRGTAIVVPCNDPQRRFIPACAGNRVSSEVCDFIRTVHPRVCGEQSIKEFGFLNPVGSSPRVRGTVRGTHPNNTYHRFIPACAGNSQNAFESRRGDTVHPRVCGEQICPYHPIFVSAGSSPRVRGTGAAGMNRADGTRRFRRASVPRTRGDEPSPLAGGIGLYGCSPHTRG